MKKLLLMAALLAVATLSAQQPDAVAPVWDVTRPNAKTASQMNAMTRMVEGSEVWRNDTKTVWRYVNGVWVDTGVSTTYTFGTGLTESGGTVTVTNPFEEADESKLDGIAAGATVGANWNTNLSNIPANLDLDGTNDVTLGGTQTITGLKTFDGLRINANLSGTQTNSMLTLRKTSANSVNIAPFDADFVNIYVEPLGSLSVAWNDGDSNENWTLYAGQLTQSRSFQFPDKNGTFAMTSDLATAGTDDQTAGEVSYDPTSSGLTATTVQSAIDEVVIDVQDNTNNISTNSSTISQVATEVDSLKTALGLPVTSQFVFVTQTVADTAVVADARDNRVILLDYDDENFTIPAGVFDTGNAIRIQSIGTGTARIVPAAGVSFAPWDGFELDSIGKAITLARINFDTGPEDWFPLDGYIKNYFEDPAIGNLLTANFYGNISFPNTTTAPTWAANVGSVVTSLETGTVFYGTTALRYDCDTCGTNAFVYMSIPTTGLTTGDSITVTFRYYNVTVPAGSTRRVRLYDPTTLFSSFNLLETTGEWLEGSVTHTLGQASDYRLYFSGNVETIFDYIKVVKNP